ncbi:bifunctional diaminohydroxyphosphoribosylaminopyrimidine deaminase/5-amino-6-(5-phosphoribosylamino)uracil reductase RibD [Oceanicola sp. D3]|uniref:bifunctional diaminohydroxyphosphoribosylaminopyrimidine deaminase/5-amino-6-(5-phosphoribosylamino)uracil reductase RibD n=1 Tax=Oceanicola sp. D3 TaxID=2587163 RepID=UPI00111CABFB|nr:bifunctional diaminohydroxyphosphoribosylaminopyrimidine deaminase/5-amino-6-(5-phosphoribosylamino)uracil reductase RibD [Oceanicola sp. D3]QDC11644.1 bifunctional diaminohydroxyphosphoribosylaminopyrimidine deaminase/5-amino-6-(5-phosphoribosylamino)uracil reductase RibD [Oceanicola sp. D3]
MARALSLGARGLGQVWPNPAVGCVIVKDQRVVGRGWTQPGGRPHAEVMALRQAGAAARGATAYVTLEPCAHHGKTPPCSEALIEAGVARVVAALQDPDPRTAGQGMDRLREAGIRCETNVMAQAAQRAHTGFFSRVQHGRPQLTLKLASSFDGRIATASGESKWITGPAARHAVQGLRASHDAVLVGAGTARADDPALTLRGYGERRPPVRVVVSRRLDVPTDGQLARTAHEQPLWLCHGADAPEARKAEWAALGAELIEVPPGADRHPDPVAMLELLGTRGLTRVLCEGGGMLAASLMGAGLVDRLIGFTAGLVLGAEGQPSFGPLGLSNLSEAVRYVLEEEQKIGPDLMATWVRAS